MKKTQNSYKKSGVNISIANKFVNHIAKVSKKNVKKTDKSFKANNIGAFGSAFDISNIKIKDPVIVSCTDGVGTKIDLANKFKKFDTIGIDLVAMCVNDLIVQGAKPLFFLDYIAVGKLNLNKTKNILNGILKGCSLANCSLIGGETAEMPGIYTGEDFDLVGFVVGVLDDSKICDNTKVKKGDVLVGLPSNGIHTNGFSLIRNVFKLDKFPSRLSQFEPSLNSTLGDELLKPHISYLKQINQSAKQVKAICHITGGGFYENLPRVLPSNVTAKLYPSSWDIPNIFNLIQNEGNVSDEEMWNVFNMGMGMILIVSPENLTNILSNIPESTKIGELIEKNNHQVIIDGIESN